MVQYSKGGVGAMAGDRVTTMRIAAKEALRKELISQADFDKINRLLDEIERREELRRDEFIRRADAVMAGSS